MSTIFMFFVTLVVASSAVDAHDEDKCLTLLSPETTLLMCCDGPELLDPDQSDCEIPDSQDDESSCELEECILESKSILFDNGTLDEVAAMAMLNKFGTERPERHASVDKIKAQCLDGNFRKYGPKIACDAMKFITCGYVHILLECPKWTDSQECSVVKELTMKCKTYIDKTLQELTLDN